MAHATVMERLWRMLLVCLGPTMQMVREGHTPALQMVWAQGQQRGDCARVEVMSRWGG